MGARQDLPAAWDAEISARTDCTSAETASALTDSTSIKTRDWAELSHEERREEWRKIKAFNDKFDRMLVCAVLAVVALVVFLWCRELVCTIVSAREAIRSMSWREILAWTACAGAFLAIFTIFLVLPTFQQH